MNSDSTLEVFRSDPDKLARIFELGDEGRPAWRPEELGAILQHQLSAPVEFDLQTLDPGSQRLLKAAAACGDSCGSIRTFADLFHHPDAPIQLLKLTKDFAKSHLNHPDSPLPKEIASVLYYASIGVALVRWERRITRLSDAALRTGLERVLDQPWLDDPTRALLHEALGRLPQAKPDAADRPPRSGDPMGSTADDSA